jgi:acetyl-CoA carboxylase biotin carboxyl carrier protein
LSHDNLTYDDLLRIVELIKSSEQFSEFRLKVGDIEVELRRRGAGAPAPSASSSAPALVSPLAEAPPPASLPVHTPAHEVPSWPEGSIVIRSPMVGTFYRAPEPGATPFVDVGQAVQPDTIVCIIEVMKLMNSIPAGTWGTVAQLLVPDAAPVVAGQPLIVLQPEAEPE